MEIKRSGMIAIVGRPNVGKSTLTNALVGEKIAIVTNKPQTTRNRICAIVNRGECQYVFMDTPGLHKARTRLGEYMVGVVKESVADVDAVLLLVEPIPHIGGPEAELIGRIKQLGVPNLLVINKIDTVEKEKLLSVMQVYGAAHDFAAILPISAKTGQGIDELLEMVNLQPPVTVEMREGTADITLNLIVRFGTCVPVMAEKVQKNVKSAVQNMTRVTVSRVNLIVAGLASEAPAAAAE